MHHPKPTHLEMQRIGKQLHDAVKPIQKKYPGLEVIISYSVPREGSPGTLATAIAHTFESKDPREIFLHLVKQLQTLAGDINNGRTEVIKL